MNAKIRDFRPSVSDWFVLDTAFLCSNYLCFCYHLNFCSLTFLVIRIAVSALNLQMKDFFFPSSFEAADVCVGLQNKAKFCHCLF